ncbi:MAG: protein kinase [Deltaproteobacteria bacterium]|nr:protein kinase [Deltaproteobacteria bacterium]MDQ3295968.1 protein kinase [Myxococcota bacterium]
MVTVGDSEIGRGSKIGRFVVVTELGAGGMGVVYAAHDRELDRQVALKVLRGDAAEDEDRTRMLREGQAMARVTHPNVITVYEVGIEGTIVFLAQELLDGGTLGEWLKKRQPQPAIIEKFVAAGRGLAAAHAAGLVHRDFKPDNVLLGKDGRVRVADFGLAAAINSVGQLMTTKRNRRPAPGDVDVSRTPMSPLTRTGAIMGTPMFMAPEQHAGERADERSDQFSFCVALYHALYGDWPFEGKTAVAIADAVMGGQLQPPPKDARVPARLRKILVRGLATRPADRYPSMDALLADLTFVPRRHGRTIAIATGVAALVAIAVIGGYALRSRSTPAPVIVAPPPPPPIDLKTLTGERGVEWLLAAVDRGQLDEAAEKYDLAAALAVQAGDKVQASIAGSAGAMTLVLRGKLADAETRLRDATANAGHAPLALAYADMAGAAIASARGELKTAVERSRRCAATFEPKIPILAAICFELQGDAQADSGDFAAARKAFEAGLAIARKHESGERTSTLELALAQLALDDNKPDVAIEQAMRSQAAAAERGAVSPEAHAWLVLTRARLAQGDSQKALEAFDRVKLDKLQSFRIRLGLELASGLTDAHAGDTVTGLEHIAAAHAKAEQQGFVGLVFEARLARVVVMVTNEQEGAAAEQQKLVLDARAGDYLRIAHLAQTIMER